jgi:hypothetical protein
MYVLRNKVIGTIGGAPASASFPAQDDARQHHVERAGWRQIPFYLFRAHGIACRRVDHPGLRYVELRLYGAHIIRSHACRHCRCGKPRLIDPRLVAGDEQLRPESGGEVDFLRRGVADEDDAPSGGSRAAAARPIGPAPITATGSWSLFIVASLRFVDVARWSGGR